MERGKYGGREGKHEEGTRKEGRKGGKEAKTWPRDMCCKQTNNGGTHLKWEGWYLTVSGEGTVPDGERLELLTMIDDGREGGNPRRDTGQRTAGRYLVDKGPYLYRRDLKNSQ